MAKRYLKNNGKPASITLDAQPEIKYLDKNGNSWRIEIVMHREGDAIPIDGTKKTAAEKMGLANDEKCLIYYKNGKYQKRTTIDKNRTVNISNYPHIIDVSFGRDKYNERRYTLMVGETVEVDNQNDAEKILQQFLFVDEVDQKGKILEENPYYQNVDNKPVKGKPIGNLPKIALEEFPSQSPREQAAKLQEGDIEED